MYLARGLHFGEQSLDEGEFLDVIKMQFDEVFALAMTGGIHDAKTQTAVLKTKLLLDMNKA